MDDLIKRQDALMELSALRKDNAELSCENDIMRGKDIAYEVAMNLIATSPAVNRWIPCSERLPDDRKCVLVTDGDNIEITFFDGSEWEMHDDYGNHYELYCGITHWMCLPEPPEKE